MLAAITAFLLRLPDCLDSASEPSLVLLARESLAAAWDPPEGPPWGAGLAPEGSALDQPSHMYTSPWAVTAAVRYLPAAPQVHQGFVWT